MPAAIVLSPALVDAVEAVWWDEDDPARSSLGRMPSPFDQLGPSPVARRAAEELQAELALAASTMVGSIPGLFEPEGGKMFGVLVVRRSDGRVGYLKAFSGMLGGCWDLPGYVGPLFDRAEREALEPGGERIVSGLTLRYREAAGSPGLAGLRRGVAALHEAQQGESERLRDLHRRRRAERQRARREPGADLEGLARRSRADKGERRALDAAHAAARERPERELAVAQRRLAALDRLRRMASRSLMRRIHDTYRVPSFDGSVRSLRALFTDREPPSGAGDCAAPKLLAAAIAAGLEPVALAEFWWGAPPRAGGRRSGAFYPSCREKCEPVLPFMLAGVDVAPPRRFEPRPSHAPLRIVFADERLVVIDKPAGLLSVPGRGDARRDSVLERLRARYPSARGPLLVHRLDLDTSGLLLAALDAEAHKALQRQFAARTVEKRYEAVVEGEVAGEEGRIELALRGDPFDRPRRIYDPVDGRPAVTAWRVLARDGQRVRVELRPATGRTHQLRVHAAHPLGLGAPIVGDRLYGLEGERLLLHAESLAFDHPATGRRTAVRSPVPF